MQHRRGYRKLCCFFKFLKDQSLKYIFNVIPKLTRPYSTRDVNNIPHFKVKHSFFKNTQSLLAEINWMDTEIPNAPPILSKVCKIYHKQHIQLPQLKRCQIYNNVTAWAFTFMKISLKITSKINGIHFALLVATLKIHLTFSSTVQISSIKETVFSIKLLILMVIF